jgi:hypothetical protein
MLFISSPNDPQTKAPIRHSRQATSQDYNPKQQTIIPLRLIQALSAIWADYRHHVSYDNQDNYDHQRLDRCSLTTDNFTPCARPQVKPAAFFVSVQSLGQEPSQNPVNEPSGQFYRAYLTHYPRVTSQAGNHPFTADVFPVVDFPALAAV